MAEKFDIVVIGAGAVGCAIAKQLAFDYPLRDIAVLEKLSSVGLATSVSSSAGRKQARDSPSPRKTYPVYEIRHGDCCSPNRNYG